MFKKLLTTALLLSLTTFAPAAATACSDASGPDVSGEDCKEVGQACSGTELCCLGLTCVFEPAPPPSSGGSSTCVRP